MVIKILICIVFCFISELITYKLIKKIDKKERKKLQRWESEFVEKMKPEVEALDQKYKEFLKEKESVSEITEKKVKTK